MVEMVVEVIREVVMVEEMVEVVKVMGVRQPPMPP